MKNLLGSAGKIILLLVFLLAGFGRLYSQDSKEAVSVAVLYRKTDAMNRQVEELYRQARISFTLPLRLMGGYEIAEEETIPDGLTGDELQAYAREAGLDGAVLLEGTKNSDGTFNVKAALYDVETGALLISRQKGAESFNKILEEADVLVEEVLASLLPAAYGFGSITIKTESDASLIRFSVNGIPGGRGKYTRSLLPAGNHRIEIFQMRPFGEVEVFSGKVTVTENGNETLSVSIPEITETEEDGFAAIEEGLLEAWRNGDTDSARMQFILAFALLDSPQPSETIETIKNTYQKWYSFFENGEVPEELQERFALAEAGEKKARETNFTAEQEEVEVKAGSRFAQGLTMSLGALLSAAGSAAGVYSVEKRIEAGETYADYLTAGENFDTLFADYSDLHSQYQAGTIASYSGWGAGTLALASSFLFFPTASLSLSAPGRYTATAALVLGVAGNFLQHMANKQMVENYILYEEYYSASENLDTLYEDYSRGVQLYKTGRIGGLVCWGAGTAVLAGSLLLPGRKEPVLTSWFDRILMTAGVLLITGGNVSSAFAHTYYMDADETYREYSLAASNLEELYLSYEEHLANYRLTSILAYSGWIAGTAAILTSLYVPFKRRAPVETKKGQPELLFFPSPNGIQFTMRL